jgi:hypothetical protein
MALELGFYTSRRCTMQLNQTQPSPRTVLLQLNFCYQAQTTVVSPGAHPSSYNSVATTLYPTLVFRKMCVSVDDILQHELQRLDSITEFRLHTNGDQMTFTLFRLAI